MKRYHALILVLSSHLHQLVNFVFKVSIILIIDHLGKSNLFSSSLYLFLWL